MKIQHLCTFTLILLLSLPSLASAGKISDRSSATTLSGSEIIGIIQSGSDKKITAATLIPPMKIWLPAAGCNGTTAGTIWDLPIPTPAVPACITGHTQKGVLQFDDTAGGFSAQTTLMLPSDYVGPVDVRIIWFSSASVGNVKWSLWTVCTPVNATATDDPNFDNESTVTTAAPSNTTQVQTSAINSVTMTGCTAGNLLHIKLSRDGSDVVDTVIGAANLIGIEFTIRRYS